MTLIYAFLVMYLLILILAINLYKKIFKNREPVLMILYSLFWPITGSITSLIFLFIFVYEIVFAFLDGLKRNKPFR
jgi:hypothetical protein